MSFDILAVKKLSGRFRTRRDWARLSWGALYTIHESTALVAQALRCTVVGTASDGGVRGPALALGIICTTAESRTKER